jgi:uncharacterized protein YdiU (UPF0061 family)
VVSQPQIEIEFLSQFRQIFPGDLSGNKQPRITPGVLYSTVEPTKVSNPQLLCWNEELGQELGIPYSKQLEPQLANVFTGNHVLASSQPYATRYGGHQFGHWADQLGDGRAINLGELKGLSSRTWEIQLKGAGLTPYSRHADGRAVLRSSLREYICSEAMHSLGVPTTRALSLCLTGGLVTRDMFYDGHPEEELGAIVTRVSPSFLRFGHFEILAAYQEYDLLKQLIHYSLELSKCPTSQDLSESINLWFQSICENTAMLMVHWLRVGFVHGVMNTDNMSILGETIDYGPYGFLDTYTPNWTPNTTDQNGRYGYAQQPGVALWNLQQLAAALSVVHDQPEDLRVGLEHYQDTFSKLYLEMTKNKLGLDQDLSLETMQVHLGKFDRFFQSQDIDMTLFYRQLSQQLRQPDFFTHSPEQILHSFFSDCLYEPVQSQTIKEFSDWLDHYRQLIKRETPIEQTAERMDQTNPVFIPRNYILQQAIDELSKDKPDERSDKALQAILRAMKSPYELNDSTRPYFKKRPDWAKEKPGCSQLSCSS